MARLIFGVAFMTAFRRTEMYNLKMSDVTLDESGSEPFIRIIGLISGEYVESKNIKGVFNHVKEIPKEIFIWKKRQLIWNVSVFDDIND